jgi:hypothetical protein
MWWVSCTFRLHYFEERVPGIHYTWGTAGLVAVENKFFLEPENTTQSTGP